MEVFRQTMRITRLQSANKSDDVLVGVKGIVTATEPCLGGDVDRMPGSASLFYFYICAEKSTLGITWLHKSN